MQYHISIFGYPRDILNSFTVAILDYNFGYAEMPIVALKCFYNFVVNIL